MLGQVRLGGQGALAFALPDVNAPGAVGDFEVGQARPDKDGRGARLQGDGRNIKARRRGLPRDI